MCFPGRALKSQYECGHPAEFEKMHMYCEPRARDNQLSGTWGEICTGEEYEDSVWEDCPEIEHPDSEVRQGNCQTCETMATDKHARELMEQIETIGGAIADGLEAIARCPNMTQHGRVQLEAEIDRADKGLAALKDAYTELQRGLLEAQIEAAKLRAEELYRRGEARISSVIRYTSYGPFYQFS